MSRAGTRQNRLMRVLAKSPKFGDLEIEKPCAKKDTEN